MTFDRLQVRTREYGSTSFIHQNIAEECEHDMITRCAEYSLHGRWRLSFATCVVGIPRLVHCVPRTCYAFICQNLSSGVRNVSSADGRTLQFTHWVKSLRCHTGTSIFSSCSLPLRTCYPFICRSLHFLQHQCLYKEPPSPPSFSFFQSKHPATLACLHSTTSLLIHTHTHTHTYIYISIIILFTPKA